MTEYREKFLDLASRHESLGRKCVKCNGLGELPAERAGALMLLYGFSKAYLAGDEYGHEGYYATFGDRASGIYPTEQFSTVLSEALTNAAIEAGL